MDDDDDDEEDEEETDAAFGGRLVLFSEVTTKPTKETVKGGTTSHAIFHYLFVSAPQPLDISSLFPFPSWLSIFL